MSLLFVDGFDHYDEVRLKWLALGVLEAPTFTQGRVGGQALQKQFVNGSGIEKNLTKQAEVVIGLALYTGDDFAFYGSDFPGQEEFTIRKTFNSPDDELITFKDTGGVTIMTIKMTRVGPSTDGFTKLEVIYPGPALSPTVDAFDTWNTEEWHYIQVKYSPKKAGGLIELRDGTGSILFKAEGRTTEQDDNDVTAVQLMGTASPSARYRIDDLYILNTLGAVNNNYLGDIRVTPFSLRSTLSQQSDGAGFSAINEVIMDEGTFVSMGVIGLLDNYEVEGFVCHGYTPTGTIKGIQYNIGSGKNNSGSIKYQHRVNSTDSGWYWLWY